MASGTLYGPAAGSGGHWRAYAKWSDSQTETTFTCNWTTGMQSLGWGINVNYISADAYINGNGKHVSNQTFYSGSGATVMKDLVSNSVTIKKTKSTQRIGAACTVTNSSGYLNGSSRIDDGWTIPALKSYNVAYNANGGSGAPSTQTKWYGETLTLSSVKPTRTGYTFAGWNTNSSGTGTNYSAGGSYTGNAAVTLYAKWTAITYTVSYNANGGTGAPGNQTKTYGQTLTLSTTVPTRTNYNFKGWATSASATTPNYQPGGSYTANAAVTLYAVWEIAYIAPRIANVTADRCTSDGTLSEEGTYALVKCNWATDKGMNDCHIVCNGQTYGVSGVTIGATSGVFNQVVGNGTLSTENSYVIQLFVGDTMGSSTYTITLAPLAYIIDFSPEGGIGIGVPAPNAKSFDIQIPFTNPETVRSNLKLNNVSGGALVAGRADYHGIGMLDDLSRDTLYSLAPGTYLVRNTATNGPISGYYGNLLVAYNGGNRMIVYLCYDNGDVWTVRGAAGPGGALSWAKIFHNKDHIYLGNNMAIVGQLTSGGSSAMLRMNTSNQVELNWTSGGLKGRVMKQIWSGSWSSGSITVPEQGYYNLFLLQGPAHKFFATRSSDTVINGFYVAENANYGFVCAMEIGSTSSNVWSFRFRPWQWGFSSTAFQSGLYSLVAPITKIYGLL